MDISLLQTLGANVQAARIAAGISKVDLCLAADISRPLLDWIEDGRGNIRVDTLEDLADALGTSPEELLRPHRANNSR